jgi:hypothetical protein
MRLTSALRLWQGRLNDAGEVEALPRTGEKCPPRCTRSATPIGNLEDSILG